MPKSSASAYTRAQEYKSAGFYAIDSKILFCKFCNTPIKWHKKDTVNKHVSSNIHQVNKEKYESLVAAGKNVPAASSSVSNTFENQAKKEDFKATLAKDVTRLFLNSNIVLEKLETEHTKSFFNKYIEGGGALPSVKTLRNKVVPEILKEREEELKAKLEDKHLVIHCDETTDKAGNCVFIVLFRVLDSKASPEVFVGGMHFLETANSKTSARAILASLQKYDITFDNVIGIVSDSARYMQKCLNDLKIVFGDHLLLIYCWDHKLNLIANEIQNDLKALNECITKTKGAFLNTRKRKHLYKSFLKTKYPSNETPALFPEPVMTRWATWFIAVFYIHSHLDDILEFFRGVEMCSINNDGVQYFQELSSDDIKVIKVQAAFCFEHAKDLTDYIKELEGLYYLSIPTLLERLYKISNNLTLARKKTFFKETHYLLGKINKPILKVKSEESLVQAACKAQVKLKGLILDDPVYKFYELVSIFSPTCLVRDEITLSTCEDLHELYFFTDIDSNHSLKGLIALANAVKK